MNITKEIIDLFNDKERERFETFVRKHELTCTATRTSYSYHFTPTGIGTAVEVSCHCGVSENITDYDSW